MMSSRGAGSGMELMIPGVPLQISLLPAPSASGTLLQHPGKLFSSVFPLRLTGFAVPLREKKLFPESAVFPENGGSRAHQIPQPLPRPSVAPALPPLPRSERLLPTGLVKTRQAFPGWRRSSAPLHGQDVFNNPP